MSSVTPRNASTAVSPSPNRRVTSRADTTAPALVAACGSSPVTTVSIEPPSLGFTCQSASFAACAGLVLPGAGRYG